MLNGKLNIQMLKDACKKSPKIRKLFELYAETRARGRQTSTVPRIRRIMKESGTDISRDETIDIMKLWQKAGAGRFVSGRRDQENRFLWSWDIPSLAQRVTSTEIPGIEPVTVGRAPKSRLKLPKVVSEAPGPVAKETLQPRAKLMTVKFAGFEIELPKDMTPEERSEAESFIKTLRGMS